MKLVSAIVASCTMALAVPASAQQVVTVQQVGPACANYVTGPSPSAAAAPATVTFQNNRANPIHAAWINYEGDLALYATIQLGGSHTQETFAGHLWVMLDSTDLNCVMGTSVTDSGVTYQVQ